MKTELLPVPLPLYPEPEVPILCESSLNHLGSLISLILIFMLQEELPGQPVSEVAVVAVEARAEAPAADTGDGGGQSHNAVRWGGDPIACWHRYCTTIYVFVPCRHSFLSSA